MSKLYFVIETKEDNTRNVMGTYKDIDDANMVLDDLRREGLNVSIVERRYK